MFLLFWEVSPTLHLVDSQNFGNLLQIGSKKLGRAGCECGDNEGLELRRSLGGKRKKNHLLGSSFQKVIYRPPASEASGSLLKMLSYRIPPFIHKWLSSCRAHEYAFWCYFPWI